MEIRKATDLELLPPELKAKIKEVCGNQDPSDEKLIALAKELGIDSLFPEGRVADIFRIWLKATGFIKAKGTEDNEVAIISWIDMEAKSFLDGNPNENFKGEEIKNMLAHRVAIISDMFLKSNELLEQVTAKLNEQPAD
jgi:hypothetical protein